MAQTVIASSRRSRWFPQSRLSHPTPLDLWDSDEVLRAHLALRGEPSGLRLDAITRTARLDAYRDSLRAIQGVTQDSLAYIDAADIHRKFADISFRRKLLLWATFPLLDLPTEIICHIFRLIVGSSKSIEETNLSRLRLTWVCRRFRDVAVGDPFLWHSVWFQDPAPWNQSLAFLQRAKSAPLDIRIFDGTPSVTLSQIHMLLDTLLKKIGQVRVLVVTLYDMDVVCAFLQRLLTSGVATELLRIEVSRYGALYLWPPPYFESPLLSIPTPSPDFDWPKLKSVCLDGVTVDWYRVSFNNLTTLDLRHMSLSMCPSAHSWMNILAASPSLYKLSLNGAGPQWTEHDLRDIRPVTLLNLRELHLRDIGLSYALVVLSYVHVPRVMNLALMDLNRPDHGPLIEALIDRFPEVRVLSLYSLQVDRSVQNTLRLARWLDSMPRLKYLKIANVKGHILRAFLADPRHFRRGSDTAPSTPEPSTQPVICPELDTLYFHIEDTSEVLLFTERRRCLGVPFQSAYTPDSHFMQLTSAEKLYLGYSVTNGVLFLYRRDAAPEEEELRREFAETSMMT